MNVESLLPWFRLKAVPGVGDLLFRRLVVRFGGPEGVFSASRDELGSVEGMTAKAVDAVLRQPTPVGAKREVEAAAGRGIAILTQSDPAYPGRLLEIPDPPPLLYMMGTFSPDAAAVAVVGSRNATSYGLETTERLCRDLARGGVAVISGMARGIDTAAHRGALDGGGTTVAVLGCGLNTVYPPENRALFERIPTSGAVVSEFPLDAGPDPHHFPRRNRIISGMSMGTVVVEATRRSGSLITARLALEQGREVFAVPGSVHSFKSAGTHALIKEGARLVESSADIYEELPMLRRDRETASRPRNAEPAPEGASPEQIAVLEAIGPCERQFDDIARRLAMPAARLSALLLDMELKGLVRAAAGSRYRVLPAGRTAGPTPTDEAES